MPYLDELKSAMFQMVDDASSIFGPDFSGRIVPAFDVNFLKLKNIFSNSALHKRIEFSYSQSRHLGNPPRSW